MKLDALDDLVLAHYWVWLGFTASLCASEDERSILLKSYLSARGFATT